MSDIVIDSCVAAKWILPEMDFAKARRLISDANSSGDQLIVLDLAIAEVTNVIWKKHRQRLVTMDEAKASMMALSLIPANVEPAAPLMPEAFDIAVRYDRSVYDAAFVALAKKRGARGITADKPLYNAIHKDFPGIVLLRNC